MKTEQIIEVLDKLIGPVYPWADAAIDSRRLENMETYIEVFSHMHTVIDDVAYQHKDSPYGSAKRIGELCAKHIESMDIKE